MITKILVLIFIVGLIRLLLSVMQTVSEADRYGYRDVYDYDDVDDYEQEEKLMEFLERKRKSEKRKQAKGDNKRDSISPEELKIREELAQMEREKRRERLRRLKSSR